MAEKYTPIDELASVVQMAESWGLSRRQLDYAVEKTSVMPAEQRGNTKLYDREAQKKLGEFIE